MWPLCFMAQFTKIRSISCLGASIFVPSSVVFCQFELSFCCLFQAPWWNWFPLMVSYMVWVYTTKFTSDFLWWSSGRWSWYGFYLLRIRKDYFITIRMNISNLGLPFSEPFGFIYCYISSHLTIAFLHGTPCLFLLDD